MLRRLETSLVAKAGYTENGETRNGGKRVEQIVIAIR